MQEDAEKAENVAESERDERQTLNLIRTKQAEIDLRAQVQQRFFSRAADNVEHSQRILWLQSEIRDLEKFTQRCRAFVGQESSMGKTYIPKLQMKTILLGIYMLTSP